MSKRGEWNEGEKKSETPFLALFWCSGSCWCSLVACTVVTSCSLYIFEHELELVNLDWATNTLWEYMWDTLFIRLPLTKLAVWHGMCTAYPLRLLWNYNYPNLPFVIITCSFYYPIIIVHGHRQEVWKTVWLLDGIGYTFSFHLPSSFVQLMKKKKT